MPPLSIGLTRRRLGLAAGAVTLAGLLAACGDDDSDGSTSTPKADGSAGPWTWTDDRGDTVELPARPERIVVSQWLLPAFWALGIKPVGVLTFMAWDDIDGYAEAGISEGDVQVLSTDYGEVDLEAMVALRPDLVVLDSYEGSETLWGFTDVTTQKKAARIAPLVAISAETDALAGIAARHDLAAALGADLGSDDVVAAKKQFDDATADIEAVLAEKPDLVAAFVGPFADGLWVAPASDYADLVYLQGRGLNVWAPAKAPEGDIFSWENATDVDADVLLIDDRDSVDVAVQDYPVFARLDAVQAEQAAAAWRFALPYEYAAFARSFEALLEPLRAAKILSA